MIEEPTGWRPEAGETVSGTVADLSTGWSDYTSAYYPIVAIKTANGIINVHCFHSVLRNRLESIQPNIGDRLTITYLGKRPSKDGTREIATYRVDAPDRRQDAKAYWSGLAGPSRTPRGVPLTDSPGRSGSRPEVESDLPADLPF